MSFKKVGDAMKTETVYCSCGGEFVNNKCNKCKKEIISKDSSNFSMGCSCDKAKCSTCDDEKN